MSNVSYGEIKKRYRVIIQERKSKLCKKEKATSFMIYDYEGSTTLEYIKENLINGE